MTILTTLLHRFKDLNKPADVTTQCTTPETTTQPAITTDVALPDDRKFEVSCTQNLFVLLLRDTCVRVYLNVIAIFYILLFLNIVPILKRHLLHIVIIVLFEYTPVPPNSEKFTFPLLYVAIGSVVSVVVVVVTIASGNMQLSVYIVIHVVL